jgi:predicted nucleic acid-binding protein
VARVALDADIVIAFLDPGDDQHERVVADLRPLLASGAELFVGATVYAETIVRPLQEGADATVDAFLDAAGVNIVEVDRAVARRAARLRADHASLRLADAISLATALASNAALLTLDRKLDRIAKRAQPRDLT